MSNEAVSLSTLEHRQHLQPTSAYESIETVQSIATRMHFLTTTGIEQMALVAIALSFEHEGKAHTARSRQANQSTIYYLEHLRSFVRKTDTVFLLGHSLYFLLLGAALQGGEIVQTRLWEALLWRVHHTHELEFLRPRAMAIGHSAFPFPQTEATECIIAANEVQLHLESPGEKAVRKPVGKQVKQTQEQIKEAELSALARKLGIPYLTLLPRKLPEQVQQLVNPQLAQELRCYPLGRERGTLTVAMSNPQDHSALDRLHRETGLHIFPVLAPSRELQVVLDQLI